MTDEKKLDDIGPKFKTLMALLGQMTAQFSRSDERKIKRLEKRCGCLKNSYLRMLRKSPAMRENTSLIILFSEGKVNAVYATGAERSINTSVVSFLLNERFTESARVAVDIAGASVKEPKSKPTPEPDAADSKPDNETESKPE